MHRHPDLWAFCNILASRHKGEPPDISGGASGGASLLPHFSAAEMLWTPILARGAGLQLKRASTASQPQDSTRLCMQACLSVACQISLLSTAISVLSSSESTIDCIFFSRNMSLCNCQSGRHR